MKLLKKISIALASLLFLAVPVGVASARWSAKTQEVVADSVLLGNATGYTKASDVVYKKNGSTVINWGAREEDCTFLTTYAQSFYTGSYTYASLSQQSGGSSQSNASSSALYKSLQNLMKSNHDHETNYGETRYQYCYTDCVNGNSSYISSFYSGKRLNGSWGDGWNREHTWPNSKGLGGNDENDIMMLRPTATSENDSRGNTAYGQSGGYYDPNREGNGEVNLRGDCARIVLYVYVRWGNKNYMWGKSGVMESLSVLLAWMEEDPVDTWEMGRNDSVQSITGTRNVFVDYPEFAWQLFGKTAPEDMPTPSGQAKNSSGGNGGGSSSSDSGNNSGDSSGNTNSGDSSSNNSGSVGDSSGECQHNFSEWIIIKEPTETADGTKWRMCEECFLEETVVLPKTGNGQLPDDSFDTNFNATCSDGKEHDFSEWFVWSQPTENKDGLRIRTCYNCGAEQKEIIPKTGNGNVVSDEENAGCGSVVLAGSSMLGIVIFAGCVFVLKKKKD